MAFIKKHFLKIIIIPLLILMTGTSYYRFIVLEDYFVIYEIDCDPTEASCFIGCENDDESECSEEYFYALIERKATELRQLCGNNVSACEEAHECAEGVAVCEITYCDPTSLEEVCVSKENL